MLDTSCAWVIKHNNLKDIDYKCSILWQGESTEMLICVIMCAEELDHLISNIAVVTSVAIAATQALEQPYMLFVMCLDN